ncbi:hypothetical protein WME91_40000 [Sorangium sp. So ce269]
MRTARRLALASPIASLVALHSACSPPETEPDIEMTAVAPAALSFDAKPVDRVIPLRFVQFVDGANDALSTASLNEQIAGANAAFARAGLRFKLAATVTVQSPAFATLDASYTWPASTSTAPPLAFAPDCVLPTPTGSEQEINALLRAGSYCGNDREILVYTVKAYAGGSLGPYPWEANALIMSRGNMAVGYRVLAHELGHYLGLPHAFRGAALAYDLDSANLMNPETGLPARLSDFWDLVYKPADLPPATAANVYFSSRAQAAGYPQSSLRPIQGNSAWEADPLGYVCRTSLGDCPGQLDYTLRLAVPRSGNDYYNCNKAEPEFGLYCVCALDPSQCDILYTGHPGLKGLGLALPGHSPSSPNLGANLMSYNYPRGPSIEPFEQPGFIGDRWALSESQLEQIKRVLTFDIGSASFPAVQGHRPRLGVGPGWGSWERIGSSVRGRPAAATRPSGQIDLLVNGADDTTRSKVQNPGSPPAWWPSALDTSDLGGGSAQAPSVVRRGEYLSAFMRGTNGFVYHKVWDPNLGGWWPSQSGWDALGGPVIAPPVAISRDISSLDVFAWDTNNQIVTRTWTTASGGWSPSQSRWTNLGVMGAAPTASSWGPGHIDLLALDATGKAFNKVFNEGAGWWPSLTGWQGLGARQFAETPTIVSWGVDHLDVVGRGTDGRAYNKVWTGTGWAPSQTEWYDLGGSLAGPPSAVSSSPGHLDVVARGTDGSLLYKSWSSGSWWPSQTEWATLTIDIGGDPLIVSPTPGKLDVFVVGSDATLWHRSRSL